MLDHDGYMCLADSVITHTIFKDEKYFSYLVKRTDDNTISISSKIIEGYGRANIILCEEFFKKKKAKLHY